MDRTFISRRHIRIPITWVARYEGDGVFGTGVVQNFSVDGWRITTIEPRPIHVGMRLALRVTLPNQPIPIKVEAATVQWVNGREFGVQVVSTGSEDDVSQGLAHADRSIGEASVMSPTPPPWATSVLLIDGNHTERAFYADGLKRCSPDYLILEATDGQSGLDLYRRSRRIDCVVMELSLSGESAFALLLDILPIASRPNVAVIVLSHIGYSGLWELAKEHGVYACFLKQHTSGEMLDKAIQRAIAFVGQMPKEDRQRPL